MTVASNLSSLVQERLQPWLTTTQHDMLIFLGMFGLRKLRAQAKQLSSIGQSPILQSVSERQQTLVCLDFAIKGLS